MSVLVQEMRTNAGRRCNMDAGNIAACLINSAHEIHKRIGPGRLASVYAASLTDILTGCGLTVERQDSILTQLRGKRLTRCPRPPLVVGGMVLVEPKSLSLLSRIHKKQVLTYLKLSNLKHGLLINFGGQYLAENIERLENPTTDRSILQAPERYATLP
jgi:GxxExxY protein